MYLNMSLKEEMKDLNIQMANMEIKLNKILQRLEKLPSANQNDTVAENISDKEILTFAEAARFLGISKSLLYKLTAHLLVPHYKPRGKMVYFEKSELKTWIRNGRIESAIFNLKSEK